MLFELEQDPTGTDIHELGEFLEACGYEKTVYDDLWTILYHHEAWGSRLTFPLDRHSIPRKRLGDILAFIRDRL